MKNICLVLFFFFSLLSFGQVNTGYPLVDAKMAAIPANSATSTEAIAAYINANFKTETDKIRAVFYWTASNISYDIENKFAIIFNETSENKIKKGLETKKGVCINYAEIFNDIANKVGIKSVVIEGYTRQSGCVDYIPHAWCGAIIDGKWCVFDPTWGSGGISDGVFVKKINDDYFKVDPVKIISSHMPFDYLWQFLNYPITNQEFYESKTRVNKSKIYFDYESEISKYRTLLVIEKLISSSVRIEKNGVKNALIFSELFDKKREIEFYKQNKMNDDFNYIVNLYNEGIYELNGFVNFRYDRFKPNVPDEELKKMIVEPKNKLLKTQKLLSDLVTIPENSLPSINSIRKGLLEMIKLAEEQEVYMEKYLSKPKLDRR
ncbi:transglutaminase domain-containing protein [Flavobacterium sp. ZB4P13]|uniref:transglutaminase domain-containing protein n=1 Tax=Flavobacterium sp. ZB4P13 TaxID=3401728 RepID=UPI003AAE0269